MNDSVPELSVIMPVLNGALVIERQLEALSTQQTELPFEVLVVDGGSTDQTVAIVDKWVGRVPGLAIVRSARAGVAHQRNAGVPAARSGACAVCDCDDLIGPNWVEAMVEALDRSEIGGGPTYVVPEDQLETTVTGAGAPDWRRSSVGPGHVYLDYLPSPLGANFGFRRSIWNDLGGFDPELEGTEDLDFAFRAIERGASVAFVDGAVVAKASRSRARDRFRQHYRFGKSTVLLYRRHRQAGMPRRTKQGIIEALTLLVTAYRLLDKDRRSNWSRRAGGQVGRFVGSLRYHTLYI